MAASMARTRRVAKLGLGVPSGSAKPQLGLWMGCSLLDIT